MSDAIAILTLPEDNVAQLPILKPTLGLDVVDVRALGKNNHYTFDPGFMSTAACESKITYIDGDAGILLYRGYAIEPLAEKAEFSEVIHLLMHGELPTAEQNDYLKDLLKQHVNVPAQLHDLLKGFPKTAHPMAMLMSLVSALDAYCDPINIKKADDRLKAAILLIAKIPTLAAMCYHHSQGTAFIAPDSNLDYAANFLYMLSGKKPEAALAQAMDRILTLHADHEQNASTSTVRLAGSTDTNPFAAIVAGIAALWGPAHGGANEACLDMLREIGSVDRIPHFIERSKDKNDSFRLMGFGHRVYKNRDPRATFMKISCDEVLRLLKIKEPLLEVAQVLEQTALADPYFKERKLFPNVDFYSGITQTALGIPTNMFTVVFALARTTGWISQWNEMHGDPQFKIGRPRQLYTGYKERKFISLEQR